MKKVGIITAFDNQNFGNRLQNLAVQQILTERGFSVDTIVCDDGSRFRKHFVHMAVTYYRKYIKKKPRAIRTIVFYRFNRKYIHARHFYCSNYQLPPTVKKEYDYFSAGSDQIWNYTYQNNHVLRFHFLSFADDSQKVCISPSMGVSMVDEKHLELFREGLKGFRYLSCREKQGADEIARVTGRECEWLIDPTLAIPAEKWKSMLKSRVRVDKPYIFVFFLAWITDELKQFIRDYAGDRYMIVDPSDPAGPYFRIDPADFVSLLSGAHMVFTDSFHATAFSISFHVPFYVFNRNKSTMMTSRIESLCRLFHVEDRYHRKQEALAVDETCSFEEADRQLAVERRRFSEYLDKCLQA
ncbi:MAG: polysaccharide pyruvyl transferase family protein [Clostridia bacterium]|nr:polysaccharide pyruvyl transferase family protein [Clostridia bacterium]